MHPQYHINKLSQSGEAGETAGADSGLDDLDAALNNLEVKLEGSAPTDVLVRRVQAGQVSRPRGPWAHLTPLLPQDSLTTIPELKDHLRIFR